jgi:hypothetical protein
VRDIGQKLALEFRGLVQRQIPLVQLVHLVIERRVERSQPFLLELNFTEHLVERIGQILKLVARVNLRADAEVALTDLLGGRTQFAHRLEDDAAGDEVEHQQSQRQRAEPGRGAGGGVGPYLARGLRAGAFEHDQPGDGRIVVNRLAGVGGGAQRARLAVARRDSRGAEGADRDRDAVLAHGESPGHVREGTVRGDRVLPGGTFAQRGPGLGDERIASADVGDLRLVQHAEHGLIRDAIEQTEAGAENEQFLIGAAGSLVRQAVGRGSPGDIDPVFCESTRQLHLGAVDAGVHHPPRDRQRSDDDQHQRGTEEQQTLVGQ